MNPTIYILTYYQFNHTPSAEYKQAKPLDRRFLEGKNHYVYYLIDKEVPALLKDKEVVLEHQLDENLHAAGGKYFAEWSFLLAEEKYSFCQYPFFMISSRFYEKNEWLYRSLDEEWDLLFGYLQEYGWGYLPSYNRPLGWGDLSWEKNLKKNASRYQFFPYTQKSFEAIEEIFGVNIPDDYRFMASLPCNYIGFRSRKDFLEYVSFYKPFIHYFFDSSYQPKHDLSKYVQKTGHFRNEKVFTHILEQVSHLFFFKKKCKFFALHYDGYYSVDEWAKKIQRLEKFPLPMKLRWERYLRWQYRRMITEGCLAPLVGFLRDKRAKK